VNITTQEIEKSDDANEGTHSWTRRKCVSLEQFFQTLELSFRNCRIVFSPLNLYRCHHWDNKFQAQNTHGALANFAGAKK
jgi:hypothetical protein